MVIWEIPVSMSEPPGKTQRILIPDQGIPPRFWDQVVRAAFRLLMLDYDGTLAPFHVDRMKARPHAGVLEILVRIRDSGDTRLVVVSGRPMAELLVLMNVDKVAMVGSHGYEFRNESGEQTTHPLAARAEVDLAAFDEAACQAGYGERLERKFAGIVLHTRGIDPSAARKMEGDFRALWGDWKREGSSGLFELRPFDGGVELRTCGRDKGVAVGELITGSAPGTLAVYVGDDETDEDAFRVLRNRGFGFKVGAEDTQTEALGRLADCGAVLKFLETWEEVLKTRGQRGAG